MSHRNGNLKKSLARAHSNYAFERDKNKELQKRIEQLEKEREELVEFCFIMKSSIKTEQSYRTKQIERQAFDVALVAYNQVIEFINKQNKNG